MIGRFLLACVLAVAGGVQAQTIGAGTGGFNVSSTANAHTFGNATATPRWITTPGAAPYTAGNIGFASDGTIVWGQGATKMPYPDGRSADVLVKARIPKPSAAAAIAKFAMKLATPLVVGEALYGLYVDLNLSREQDPESGNWVTKGSAPVVWKVQGGSPSYTASDAMGLCTAVRAVEPSRGGAPRLYSCSPDQTVPGATCGCQPWYPEWQTDFGLEAYGQAGTVVLTEGQLADKIAAQSGWPTNSTQALAGAVAAGETVTHEPPTVSGPASVQGGQTVKQEQTPQGQKTTTGTTTYYNTYEGATVTVTTTVTNVTNNPDGTTTTTTETSETPAPAEPPEIETCGLPGKPACKIDETGTPDKATDDPDSKVPDLLKPLTDFAANPTAALPTFPTLNWGFVMPSGCTAISIPGFSPYLDAIDLCPFVDMFHDIMSVIWVMGGLFGAIGIFWRNTFSQG